jgi:molybdopterin-guanine dinucleotide biosynthesis protein A
MKRAGIVLCGGRSQRMGRPKALLPWFGRSLIEQAVSTLASCVDEVLVVTSRDLPLEALVSGLGARVVVDRDAARGPLAALRDGLVATRAERAFVTSPDTPLLEPADVEAIFGQAEAGDRAVVPRDGGFLQVLCAVYPSRLGREAEAILEAGGASLAALLERVGYHVFEGPSEAGRAPWSGFNTPDEYLAMVRRRDPDARAEIAWRSRAHAAGPTPSTGSAAPIGRLGDLLRAVAPAGFAIDDPDRLASLSIELGEGELAHRVARAQPRDLALPVGPGERVRVREG